jgi:hypothetical protein
LEKKGYEMSPALPFPRLPGRLTAIGEIARKGKTVVQVDTSAQMLNITDISVKSAVDCFDEIANILAEDHGFNLDELVKFYCFNATYEIPTEKQAYETIAKNLKIPILENLKENWAVELWPLELKFANANLKANSENWLDISVRPSYERNDSYVISTVYRNTDKAKTLKFVETFEENVIKMIELIDR